MGGGQAGGGAQVGRWGLRWWRMCAYKGLQSIVQIKGEEEPR